MLPRNAHQYLCGEPHEFWVTAAIAFTGCRIEGLAQANLTTDLKQISSYRTSVIRIFAPATGASERRSMSGRIRYTNEPIGNPKVVRDFLPSPEELAFREEDVKVTITLSKKSVDFFKSEAAKAGTQYQRMIRRLLDAYVDAHAGAASRRSTRTRAKTARAG